MLKIQNAQGRHAFIGIAFNERNDAFDFNVALQEHKAECEREDKAAAEPAVSNIPMRDLSIKSGEKITVKIAGAGSVSIFVCCWINMNSCLQLNFNLRLRVSYLIVCFLSLSDSYFAI